MELDSEIDQKSSTLIAPVAVLLDCTVTHNFFAAYLVEELSLPLPP